MKRTEYKADVLKMTNVTTEMKEEMFEKMLELEHLAQKRTFDGIDYCDMANGMFKAFEIMGIGTEYIKWSYGK